MEIATLQNQLATITQALEPRISDALALVMGRHQNDVSAFLAFAGRGDFSGLRGHSSNIANDTAGLLIGFTTFLVSEALVLNGWHVAASLGTDPLGLKNGTATCPFWTQDHDPHSDEYKQCVKMSHFDYYGLDCQGYDINGQCSDSYWWYMGKRKLDLPDEFQVPMIDNTAYNLAKDPYDGYFHSASKAEHDPTDLLQTIFSNRWSTGQLLLQDAGWCV